MTLSLYERDSRALSSLQNLRFFPLAVSGGRGCFLTEEGGRELLDMSASWGAASLGHGHPAICEALAKASKDHAGCSILSAASLPAVELAERLLALTPGVGDKRVWLGHSGSDAIETVARVVTAATGRPKILSFSGAYHGGTVGSMAVSGHSAQEGAEKSPGLTLIPYPDPYRPLDGDLSGDAALAHLRDLFRTTCPPQEVAAVFIEPIQADGGLIVPPTGYLRKLAALCAEHGILTVCDEVKVGVGRTGKMHCFMHDGFTPDIVVMGKGLGGGLPISAVIGPAHIMNHQSAFSMQTLHGNSIAACAALAVLTTIEKEGLASKALQTGQVLQDQLRQNLEANPLVGDIRGRGLAIGIELVTDQKTRAPASEAAAMAIYRAYELGAVFYYVGMNSNVLELTPPLTLSATEAIAGSKIIANALDDVANGAFDKSKITGFEGW